ncbi:hypothetical protein DN752_17820 [Echinicola strongylocentroti]|uniref:Uncharacterized protein n=1 Tax=Echinicola strongylocentroti TaxID=1795355 RepID=A0A2Z4IM83_9BACT|nr:hypothetical protein [Echinicola strongylocentroti]AWW31839.1 hypothetical protein DN752_17820 [Echinicola strongylocentroti]
MGKNVENNNVLQNRWPDKPDKELTLRTDVEKIVMYFQGKLTDNVSLSPALEQKIERMKACNKLIQKYGGAKKVIAMMESMWDVSFSTARRIYKDTQEAFGEVTYFNRQYHIDTYIQMLLEGLSLAKDSGDNRSYASLMKEYKEAIKEFMGSSEADIYEQIKIPEFQVGFFPDQLKTKLPANWKTKLEKLKAAKRKDEIDDAIIIDTEDTPEDDGD